MVVMPVTEDDAVQSDAIKVQRFLQVQEVLGLLSVSGVVENSAVQKKLFYLQKKVLI